MINLTPSDGKVTRTYVNARGSVTQVVAAFGSSQQQETTYEYDALERPVSMAPPGQQPLLFTYDSMGRRTSLTDPQIGQRPVRFTYDALGRVTSQTPLEAGGTPVTLRYDETANGKGRLTSVSDAAGTTRFVYTAMGQLRRAR